MVKECKLLVWIQLVKVLVLFYKSTQVTCTLNKTSFPVTLLVTSIQISCRIYVGLTTNSYGSVCLRHLNSNFLVHRLGFFCA